MRVGKDKLLRIIDMCIDDIEIDLKNRKLIIFFNFKCISNLLFGGINAQET